MILKWSKKRIINDTKNKIARGFKGDILCFVDGIAVNKFSNLKTARDYIYNLTAHQNVMSIDMNKNGELNILTREKESKENKIKDIGIEESIKRLGENALNNILSRKSCGKVTAKDIYRLHGALRSIHHNCKKNKLDYCEIEDEYSEPNLCLSNIYEDTVGFIKDGIDRYIESKMGIEVKNIDYNTFQKIGGLNTSILLHLTMQDNIEKAIDFINAHETFINKDIMTDWWNGEVIEKNDLKGNSGWLFRILSYIEMPIMYCSHMYPIYVNKHHIAEYEDEDLFAWDTMFSSKTFKADFQFYRKADNKTEAYFKLFLNHGQNKHLACSCYYYIGSEKSFSEDYNGSDEWENIIKDIVNAYDRLEEARYNILRGMLEKHREKDEELTKIRKSKTKKAISHIFNNNTESYLDKSKIENISIQRTKPIKRRAVDEYCESFIKRLTEEQMFDLAKKDALGGVYFKEFCEVDKERNVKEFKEWKINNNISEDRIIKIRMFDKTYRSKIARPIGQYDSCIQESTNSHIQIIVKQE